MTNTNHYANGYELATPKAIKAGAQLFIESNGQLVAIGRVVYATRRNDSYTEYVTTQHYTVSNQDTLYTRS